MNIFILDEQPQKAAEYHCNKHVVKMILEAGQMLCAAHWMSWLEHFNKNRTDFRLMRDVKQFLKDNVPKEKQPAWGITHVNHPCTVWSRENCSNYDWHYKHFIALCNEYTYRYGKIHASETKLATVLRNAPKKIEHTTGKSPFRLAMGSNPECMFEDAVKSYRAFYQTKQARFAMKWTKRKQPEWFNAII